jgi:short-subunit dehydrogenase
LDVLVNNAGFGVYGRVLQHRDEDLISITMVNFLAPLILTKRLLEKMGRGVQLPCHRLIFLPPHRSLGLHPP